MRSSALHLQFLLCSITRSLSIFLCLLTVLRAEEAGSNITELILRNRTVLNAWQSSKHHSHCFWNRSTTEEEKFISKDTKSYEYFHSEGNSSASNGYHWLVLQLNSTRYVKGVSIKGRESANEMAQVYNRAAGIEIWTSAVDVNFIGADHCTASNLSVYFNHTRNSWTLCGITRPGNGVEVQKGEILSVNCTYEVFVKMVLFRRYVHNISNGVECYMSFSGVTLKLGQKPISGSTPTMTIVIIGSCLAILITIGTSVKFVVRLHRQHQSPANQSRSATQNFEQQQMEDTSQCVQQVDTACARISRDTGYLMSERNYQNVPDAAAETQHKLQPETNLKVASNTSLEAGLDHLDLTYAIVQPDEKKGRQHQRLGANFSHICDTCSTGSECTVYLNIIGDDVVEAEAAPLRSDTGGNVATEPLGLA